MQSTARRVRTRGHKIESQLGPITFVETDHVIISTIILSLRWFKKDSCQLLRTSIG